MKCKEPSSPLPLPTDEWMPFLSEYEHAKPVASFCCLPMPGRDGVTISVVFPQTASMTLLSPNIIRCHWFLLPVMPSHNRLHRLLFKTQPGVQG